jgi:hypothetical protein
MRNDPATICDVYRIIRIACALACQLTKEVKSARLGHHKKDIYIKVNQCKKYAHVVVQVEVPNGS